MKKTLIIGKYEFEIDNPNSVIDEKFECLQNNGRVEIRFLFNFGNNVSPKQITIYCKTNKCGCAYVWSSSSGLKRNLLPDWIGAKIQSRSVVGTPILSFADCSDKNIITISLSPKRRARFRADTANRRAVSILKSSFSAELSAL